MKSLYQVVTETEMQRVFVVLKPGSLELGDKVIDIFKENGWSVYQSTIKRLLLKEAMKLYYVHKNEEFYESLCKYMSSAPCRAFIFEKPGKQSQTSFDEVAKIKDEIRQEYGESEMRNVLHSSDSEENMKNEASIFFNLISESLLDDENELMTKADKVLDFYKTARDAFKNLKYGISPIYLWVLKEVAITGKVPQSFLGFDGDDWGNWGDRDDLLAVKKFLQAIHKYDDILVVDWASTDDAYDYKCSNKLIKGLTADDRENINDVLNLNIQLPLNKVDQWISGWDDEEENGYFICSRKDMKRYEKEVMVEMMEAVLRYYK